MEIERYLTEKKEEIRSLKVEKRSVEFPAVKFGVAVIGPRRAGKSFSIFDFIKTKRIEDSDYVFVNYEDDEIKTLKRREKVGIVETHIELYRKHPLYVFLDEVHALERWESFVYSLIEKKRYHVFITGSNSKLLSKEIATQLRGRVVTVPVFPFSFREYLNLKKVGFSHPMSSSSVSRLKGYLKEYLMTTGFPPVLIDGLNPKIFFKEYVDLVVFRDIVERFRIKNIHALRYLIGRIVSSFSSKFSVNKVFNELRSESVKVGKGAIYEYAKHLEEVMFSFFLKKFYFSQKKTELSVPKVYLCDLGLANYLLATKFSEDIGRAMENLVFTELKKKELCGEIDLFYWESENREVDFVIKEGFKVKELIQVTYASGRDEVEKREITSLLKGGELLKCKDLLCITWDYEAEEEIKGRSIRFIPLWKWLLKIS